MTTHYGKRNLGLGTASSPGDTLYIPLAFYNDSGASISIGNTLVAGDIEVFKNGSVAQRATDSGYAVLGDTGNFDNRIGFKGISISLYNTADDASFYAVGSTYWVAIDSVTVDARTVRFFPAVFEIGENRANVVQMNGDTGAASVLQQFANTNGTLSPTGELDTGSVANSSYLPANVIRWLGTAAATPTVAGVPKVEVVSLADTGINDSVGRIRFDVDTGLRVHIDDSDTGIKDTIADLDTGLRALLALRDTGAIATAVWAGDTGLRERLGRVASDVDTGLRTHIDDSDTGLKDVIADLDTGIRALLALRDTGAIATAVWAGDTGIRAIANAVKTKTDSLTFTVANTLDVNIEYVNATQITGTGDTGLSDPWRPV